MVYFDAPSRALCENLYTKDLRNTKNKIERKARVDAISHTWT